MCEVNAANWTALSSPKRSQASNTARSLAESYQQANLAVDSAWNPQETLAEVTSQSHSSVVTAFSQRTRMSSVRWNHGSLYWQDTAMSLKAASS